MLGGVAKVDPSSDPMKRASMRTAITTLLGIETPIVQSGIRWLAQAPFVAAVANAGALGLLSAHTQPDGPALQAEIRRTRALTGKVFGVNLTLLPATSERTADYIAAIVAEGITIVETAGANPAEPIAALKRAGVTVIHKCTAVRHALTAERLGADIISITGFEAAGHPGEDDVPSLVLVPAAVRRLRVPVLASGGFADGRGLAAALALGAAGITMGTRFMLTAESPVHPAVKARMLAAGERDTTLVCRSLRDTTRVLRNDATRQILELERSGTDPHLLHRLAAPSRWVEAFEAGELDGAAMPAGVALGLIDDLPSCVELVRRIVADAGTAIERAAAAFRD